MVRGRGVRLISDEVYHGLVYDGAPETQLRLGDIARCRGGQQLFEVLRDDRVAAGLAAGATASCSGRWTCLTGNFTICPPVLAAVRRSRGVHAANPYAEADALRASTTRPTGNCCSTGCARLGIDRLAPTDGAFYVYADVVAPHHGLDRHSARKLLNDTGVAIAPGIDFDTVRGGSFVRLSFAGPTGDIEEALRRIGSWLG